MKKYNYLIVFAVLICASAFKFIDAVNWKVKGDASVITLKGGKIDAQMKGLKATILFDDANPEKSKFSATLEAKTFNSGNGMMNKHAQSEEALNTEKFPLISFESTSVTGKDGAYTAQGKLTIKDVTKDIALPFSFEQKGAESLFKGKFSIVPKEFNITRGGTPDKLEIELTVPVTK